MQSFIQLSLACVILTGSIACNRTNEQISTPDDTLAIVGDAHINQADLTFAQKHLPGLSESAALDRIISEEVLAQSALKAGFAEDPAIRAAIRRMLSSRYLEKHLSKPIAISEEAVKLRWEESEERFTLSKQARVSIIRQTLDPQKPKQHMVDQLQQIRLEYLQNPEEHRGFGRSAAIYSDHQDTRYQGGACGWVKEGSAHAVLPQEVIQLATQQSKLGPVETIIEADDALWLLLVEEIQPRRIRPFDEVADLLRQEMSALAQSRAKEQLLEETAEAIPTEILKALPDTDVSELVSLTSPEDPF